MVTLVPSNLHFPDPTLLRSQSDAKGAKQPYILIDGGLTFDGADAGADVRDQAASLVAKKTAL